MSDIDLHLVTVNLLYYQSQVTDVIGKHTVTQAEQLPYTEHIQKKTTTIVHSAYIAVFHELLNDIARHLVIDDPVNKSCFYSRLGI